MKEMMQKKKKKRKKFAKTENKGKMEVEKEMKYLKK